jgi:hypothetical protein
MARRFSRQASSLRLKSKITDSWPGSNHIRRLFRLFDRDGNGCFSDDTRLLTSEGFLFRAEIQDRLERNQQQGAEHAPQLLFACYDIASQQIVFRPCKGNQLSADYMADEMICFEHDAAKEGNDDASDADTRGANNGVSMLVTPNHRMYAQRVEGKRSDERQPRNTTEEIPPLSSSPSSTSYEVAEAASFVQSSSADGAPSMAAQSHSIRFLARAAGGVRRSPAERTEFLQICRQQLQLQPCATCCCLVDGATAAAAAAHPPPLNESTPPACPVLAFLELYGP